jgi:hypothetical protein
MFLTRQEIERRQLESEVTEPGLGIYLPDGFHSAPGNAMEYQRLLGARIAMLSFYVAWGSACDLPDLAGIERVLQNGFTPMITWEPWALMDVPEDGGPEHQPAFSLGTIKGGRYDEYIRNWALELNRLSAPVFLRPMHEMNGNWYPWCGTVNGNGLADYVEAWRHMRSIFREVGNDKIIWVWSPYVHSVPDEPGNEISDYFPGTGEVDWLGLDGYNWGKTRDWSSWQDFPDIFDKAYNLMTQLAPGKPFMIAEVGCAEQGGDKGRWIKDAAEALRIRFAQIKTVVWFNVDKECDWRIESSKESLNAFAQHWTFRRGRFQDRLRGG